MMEDDSMPGDEVVEVAILTRRAWAAEKIAGLPRDAIMAYALRALVDQWTTGEPGALARWITEHFPAERSTEGRARLTSELFRLEARMRSDEDLETEEDGLGWDKT
jgi:hypothetical protein